MDERPFRYYDSSLPKEPLRCADPNPIGCTMCSLILDMQMKAARLHGATAALMDALARSRR